MSKEQFKTGDSPFIRVESCGGNLFVRGSAESILQVKGDYQVDETQKGYNFTSSGNLHLYVPRDATLSVGRVNGDLNVKQFIGGGEYEYVHGDAVFTQTSDIALDVVHGDLVARNLIGGLAVNEVNGDLVGRAIGPATIGVVHGDISARVMDGDLTIDAVHGDADLRTVNGNVQISQGFRDVNLNAVSGQVSIMNITGDVRLRGGLGSGDHAIEARGDIVMRWPAGMALNLSVNAGRIDNRLQFDEVTEKKGSLAGTIGEFGANVSLASEGRVILRESEAVDDKWNEFGDEMNIDFDFEKQFAGIAARIESEVNEHISRVTRELETKFGPEFSQQINDKIARKMEHAASRFQRHRPENRGRAYASAAAAAPPRKPASTEEQLKILKMVETGKISPEEASMLLEALEG